jgi:hypothetical protein
MTIILSPGGKLWRDFRPGVMMSVRGVPMHVLDYQIQQAAIEFCKFSNCLRSDTITLATTDGGDTYALNPPADVSINNLHQAWVNGVEVDVLDAQGWLDRDPLAAPSVVTGVYLNSPVQLLTAPPAAAGSTITGVVSYVPTDTASVIDSQVFARWHKGIEAKAIAELLLMPEVPWAKPDSAMYFMSLYGRDLTLASNEAGPVKQQSLRARVW